MKPSLCRRCGQSLDSAVPEDGAGSRMAIGDSSAYEGWRCASCGWIHVGHVPNDADLSDLPTIFRDLGLELPDATGVQEVEGVLRSARSLLIAELRRMVLEEPFKGIALLLNGIRSISFTGSNLEDMFVISLQQVYACLATLGPMQVADSRALNLDPGWSQRVAQLTGAISVLSSLIRELPLGTVVDPSIRSGHYTTTMSEGSAWAFEVNANGVEHVIADPLEELSEVDLVEREVFEVSTYDLLGLLRSPGTLEEFTRVNIDNGIAYIDLESDNRIVDLLADRMLLTADRWASRTVPSFFFADDRGGYRSEQAMVAAASELDWFRYAPLLSGMYVDGSGQPHPLALTSYGLVERAVARSGGSLANRLHLAEKAAREVSPELVAVVRERAREVHQAFERAAARACESRGLTAVAGLETLGGKQLACGEIDTLALGDGVLLVIECKNVDLTFFKDLGVTQAADTMARAAGQARRKAAWAVEHWPSLTEAFPGLDAEPVVVPMVVTRFTAFPSVEGVPVLAMRELDGAVGALLASGGRQWHPVIGAASPAP